MTTERKIAVEVVYATATDQWVRKVTVPVGSTAREVIEKSRLHERLPNIESHRIGVFSRLIDIDDVVSDGDRIEIYRPLKADPRTVRRRLAKVGRTMGRSRQ